MEKKVLVSHIFTADPSAKVIDGVLYIFPSHDRDVEAKDNDNGDQYDMNDYHVFAMEDMGRPPVDLGRIFGVEDVPWASRQLWAPDALKKNGQVWFYFPARDKDGIFRIGVARADRPAGPYHVEPDCIPGSFSIDPCIFEDDDGEAYMGFGGLWGGQLEKWKTGVFDPQGKEPPAAEAAVCPKLARMSADMKSFAESPRDLVILDKEGSPLLSGDEERRYFEDPWLHKYQGRYYFSWSTGTTHKIAYATAENVWGPYTYQDQILSPVLGWTTHHSIVEYQGKWYLFYHDSSLSGGINHKRSVKFQSLSYRPDGSIVPMEP